MMWLSLIVTLGVAVYWFVQARKARDELFIAREIITKKLNQELKTRPSKIYLMPPRAGGGDAA